MAGLRSFFRRSRDLRAPAHAPGTRFVPGDTAEAHRERLLAQLKAQAPDSSDALNLITRALDALPDPQDRAHLSTHTVRYLQTYLMAPQGPDDRTGRVLDIGGPSIHNAPLQTLKRWQLETVEMLSIDYERDSLPYRDESQDGVLLCEVIEHFVIDPMFCLAEINRVLKTGGFFVVTTPNAASWFSIYQALEQRHPNRWPVYSGTASKARNHIHAREYLVSDLSALLNAAGFEVTGTETRDYGIAPEYVPLPGFPTEHRGETIFLCAVKAGPPLKRFAQPVYLEDVPAG